MGTTSESQLGAVLDAVGSAFIQIYDAVGWIIPAVLLTLLLLAFLCAIGAVLGTLLGDAAGDLFLELPLDCVLEGGASGIFKLVRGMTRGNRRAGPDLPKSGRATGRIDQGPDE